MDLFLDLEDDRLEFPLMELFLLPSLSIVFRFFSSVVPFYLTLDIVPTGEW